MPACMLRFEAVSFAYDAAKPLIAGFNWQVEQGDSWAILGPSGSGKTTLLYLMAGLRHPTAGTVYFRGQPQTQPSPRIGLMLQAYGLLPWFSAAENIAVGLKIRRLERKERRKITQYWLKRLEIAHIASQFPSQLSGGQRQRVALARLLALDSEVNLLDEPLAAVDELTRERLQKLLWSLQRDLGMTTVMVTHNVEEAALLANKILIIGAHTPITTVTILDSPLTHEDYPQRHDRTFVEFTMQIRRCLGL
jgi:ABC-type nitrate/sulfonate/bicarbonate transport system ATPase subunit